MTKLLAVSAGQKSSKGRKPVNQDFHGVFVPDDESLASKGIAIAIADGISSSDVSQMASETAVKSFLADYYCTSDSWTVKASAQRVLMATNSWLYAQNKRSQYRFNKDKGYVCTFSCIIFKSTTAHLFHVGDARIYRLVNQDLEVLTEEHRLWVSKESSYLSRALGMSHRLEIDYSTVTIDEGDYFILATDGIYEFVEDSFITVTIHKYGNDLDKAAELIVDEAYRLGSEDNLTIQIIRIDQLPDRNSQETFQQIGTLPFPPRLEPRTVFDGYEIIRDVYVSSRSHVVLAKDVDSQTLVIIKTPSVELRNDASYLERFMMEEWIAKRIDSPHVLKAFLPSRRRNFLYIVTEFVDGQTLSQWMIDHPRSDVETVRGIVEQVAKGLQSFHRQEMLHQDIRPNNIMIDKAGTVKIIDFGSTFVAGLAETEASGLQNHMLGTAAFMAPEYFLGDYGTARSDLYSLAALTYQMLSGSLPYGTEVAKARTRAAQRKLRYQTILHENRAIPTWMDDTLKKALNPDPLKRYAVLSEFIYDLRNPNPIFVNKARPPLIDRNPLLFWKGVSFLLFCIILLMASDYL